MVKNHCHIIPEGIFPLYVAVSIYLHCLLALSLYLLSYLSLPLFINLLSLGLTSSSYPACRCGLSVFMIVL